MKMTGTIREFIDAELWVSICDWLDDEHGTTRKLGDPGSQSADTIRLEIEMDIKLGKIMDVVFLV